MGGVYGVYGAVSLIESIELMGSGRKALREQRKDEIAVEELTGTQEKRSSELDSSK